MVKSILDLLSRVAVAASAIALAGMLAACGQKGPLYLPRPQPAAAAKPPQTNPAPDESASPASK